MGSFWAEAVKSQCASAPLPFSATVTWGPMHSKWCRNTKEKTNLYCVGPPTFGDCLPLHRAMSLLADITGAVQRISPTSSVWGLQVSHVGSQPWLPQKNSAQQGSGELSRLAIACVHRYCHTYFPEGVNMICDSTGQGALCLEPSWILSEHLFSRLFLICILERPKP